MLARTMLTADPFTWVAREMDRLFETVAPAAAPALAAGRPGTNLFPPLNLWHDDANVYAEAELPGVSMEQIDVSATADSLTIRAQREGWNQSSLQNASLLRAERPFGQFERTVNLPFEINVEHVEATLSDGVLRITMPKAEAVRPRRIAVKAS